MSTPGPIRRPCHDDTPIQPYVPSTHISFLKHRLQYKSLYSTPTRSTSLKDLNRPAYPVQDSPNHRPIRKPPSGDLSDFAHRSLCARAHGLMQDAAVNPDMNR